VRKKARQGGGREERIEDEGKERKEKGLELGRLANPVGGHVACCQPSHLLALALRGTVLIPCADPRHHLLHQLLQLAHIAAGLHRLYDLQHLRPCDIRPGAEQQAVSSRQQVRNSSWQQARWVHR
jgi:hypothetical protein